VPTVPPRVPTAPSLRLGPAPASAARRAQHARNFIVLTEALSARGLGRHAGGLWSGPSARWMVACGCA